MVTSGTYTACGKTELPQYPGLMGSDGATTSSAEQSRVHVPRPGRVLARDTKDRDGGTLTFAPNTWRAE
jgi:hypothetical protein